MTNRRIALALCALALVSLPAAAQVCPNGGGEAIYDANWGTNQRNVLIPAGCTKLQLKAWGCGGGRGNSLSGGGAGFAQGNFRIPPTPDRTIALSYNFGHEGSGTAAGCVGHAMDLTPDPNVPLVIAAGGGGGGTSSEPVDGTPRVGGRGGAGGRNGQPGQSIAGDCNTFANGGGGATPTAPGAGGVGTYSTGQNGQPPLVATGVGQGGQGPGDGSSGRYGGGGAGLAGDYSVGDDPNAPCRYRVGAGGGGGSSWVNVSAYSPLPAIQLFDDGLWNVPGKPVDSDRYTPLPANEWAGNGATQNPPAPATKGRVIARWRGPYGFFDVLPSNPFRGWIETLACNGITSGCGEDNFCPTLPMTRGQMAPWLLVAEEGAGYMPPPCVSPGPFNDVPCTGSPVSPYAAWIQELVARQVTGGCGNGNYCPNQAVTREQMAIFLLRTLLGPTYVPPACTTPTFNDVPCSSPYAIWIEDLVRRHITGGCGNDNYCPTAAVTREQMAAFLGATFSLQCPPQ